MHCVRSRVSRLIALFVVLAAPVAVVGLTAAPAGAVDVTTATQYLTAFGTPGDVEINLLNDITFTCPQFASRAQAGTTVTVHGNGHTVHGCPTSLNHSAVSDVVFDNVIIEGGTLVVSIVGDVQLVDSQVTSSSASILGYSSVGSVDVVRSQIGPFVSAGGILGFSVATGPVMVEDSTIGPMSGPSVLGFSVAGPVTVERSTVGPLTSTAGGTLGFSVAGDVSVVDSLFTSMSGTPPTSSVSAAGDVAVTRSTLTGLEGATFIGDQVSLENSTYSNNDGPLVLVTSDGSILYSDIVDNAAPTAPTGLAIPDIPALPDGAPEGLALAVPDASAFDVGPAQVPAQLVLEGEIGLFGTVVALPVGVQNCDIVLGASTSNGYNFSDDDSCDFTDATDQEDAGDPLLGPLAGNGGPTPTRLPLTRSPLINAIPLDACQDDGAAGIATDQRGLPRPAETGCEIGSVELQPPPVPEPVVLVPTFTG